MKGSVFKEKVLGCWYGKNIGGTLGAPFEWKRQFNEVTGYTQKLRGKPLPNDDLDLQLLWLIAAEEQKLRLTPQVLGYYFSMFVAPHWAEYGISKANMKLGMLPPESGRANNVYRHSCGSYIRSELWACIAAGDPALAAKYMIADSCVDHGGNSEGTYAAVFIAAMEAAAFVVSDIEELIGIGLSYIPADCGIAGVAALARSCFERGTDYHDARDEIFRSFRGAPFIRGDGDDARIDCCERDAKLNFDSGIKGYDVVANIGIVLLGLLYGQGDFGKSLCIAVNCGEDTDCTAATLGALLGILYGRKGIPEKWLRPIGNEIVTACLNIGELQGRLPATVGELTDRVMALHTLHESLNGAGRQLACGEGCPQKPYGRADCVRHSFVFFDVYVAYPDGQYLKGGKGRVVIEVENRFRAPENLCYRWFLEDGFTVSDRVGAVYSASGTYGDTVVRLEFELSCEGEAGLKSDFLFELGVVGRAYPMPVPVTFFSGTEA